MFRKFENQIVMITGASSGIGEALALEFAKNGANVALAARRKDRLQALASRIENYGVKALAVTCDVTDDESMKSSVSEILNRFGKINIVIANAGFGVVGEVADLNLSDFKRQNETNVYGVLRTFYSTIDPLKSTHGSFVIMGSVLSYLSGPGRGPYALSKYAVRALHEALELEINKFGVQSILINPGFIKTELRRVDNEGHFHENADQNFSKLHMSAEKAAKIMLNGIYSRKREINVTFHGKILIFISKHFSFLIRLMYRLGIKGRNAVKVDN